MSTSPMDLAEISVDETAGSITTNTPARTLLEQAAVERYDPAPWPAAMSGLDGNHLQVSHTVLKSSPQHGLTCHISLAGDRSDASSRI